MKKLKQSAAAKAAAFILLILTLAVTAASLMGVMLLYSYDGFLNGFDAAKEDMLENWCSSRARDLFDSFLLMKEMPYTDSAFAYTLYDKDGNEVYSTLDGRETQLEYGYYSERIVSESIEESASRSSVWYNEASSVEISEMEISDSPASGNAAVTYSVTEDETDTVITAGTAGPKYEAESAPYSLMGYILADIPADSELYYPMKLLDLACGMNNGLIAASALAALISAALFVFLMSAAGRRAPDGEIVPAFAERIPFDVFTAICAALVVAFIALFFNSWYLNGYTIKLAAASLCFICGAAAAIWWCMSFSVRVKMKTAIKSCVIYRLFKWFGRGMKKLFGFVGYVFKNIPLIPKTALCILGLLFLEFIFLLLTMNDGAKQLLWWLFERGLLTALVLYIVIGMNRLLTAGREIAKGNLDYRVDTARLIGPIKEHGEDLNSITDGMTKAVNDRLKSERFRTELITNVSHDIKTPLTSIISYVDLLEKEDIQGEKAREYLAVLSRQSSRLKKLIEDLLEASKASTGNLTVEPERVELGIMLEQTVGEYAEKLEKAGLTLVTDKCEEPVYIMADRRHLWRVFDNLMNNICKYALSGTRVYLDVKKRTALNGSKTAQKAVVTFRNISRSRLNVSEEELMERFVRGDSSRSTEGSGLGLSIANSLTKLQKGEMSLTVDGDLFKVSLTFDTVE